MTIGDRLKQTDRDTYNKLLKMCSKSVGKSKAIKLGCSVEELMRHDSFIRVGGRIKQKGWN